MLAPSQSVIRSLYMCAGVGLYLRACMLMMYARVHVCIFVLVSCGCVFALEASSL